MKISRIFVDTNVLISAYVFGGKIERLLKELVCQNYTLCVSEFIDFEFRLKLDLKWKEKKILAIKKYEALPFVILSSTDEIFATIRDENDIRVLNDAIYHGVDILLTGDKDFAEVKITAEKPKIMTPMQLAQMLEIEI